LFSWNPPDREKLSVIITERRFECDGVACAGTLMLPDGSSPAPVIVMAHGFANIRTARLPAYAERFVDAGYAVFTFDYRTFGDSEGEPRYLVHPMGQIRDWNAAIEYVRNSPEVDARRLVLWGTSFSGGHVLHLAAQSNDYAAVIAQIPHVSGIATIRKAHPLTTIKGTLAGMFDAILSLAGRTHYSPVTGRPGECAAITAENASEDYARMLPDDANWANRALSRSFLYIPLYSPRNDVHRISAPTLIVAARRDSVVPASAARRAARRIPNCEFRVLDASHFEPYFGSVFEESVGYQIDFLRKHVPTGAL
jgi:pimeloyl-ACP methyl ester carboxylesterase